jgi:hypothetical protein
MQDQPVRYRINPLPQEEVPDRGFKQAPPLEHPANLYKPSQPQGQRSPTRPSSIAEPLTNHPTESPAPPRLHSEYFRPTPTPASRQQLAEARAIAQRVQDRSGSSRLEYLLRRQQSKRYSHDESDRQPRMALEHLAIIQRIDGSFQIVIRGTQTTFSRYVFQTVEHCAEAAAELEQKFELSGMLEFVDAEVLEHVEAIVRACVARERVAVELARSM